MTKEQIDRLNFWGKAITKYGISTVLLGVLAWWVHDQIEWTKDHVATPLVANHLHYLKTNTENAERQARSFEVVADTLESLEQAQKQTIVAVQETGRITKEEHAKTRAALERIGIEQAKALKASNDEQSKGREDAVKLLLEKAINGKQQ